MQNAETFSQKASSSNSFAGVPRRAAGFLESLVKSGAALLWRNHAWHIMAEEGVASVPVSRYRTRMIRSLAENGLLAVGDDGLLRPRAQSPQPVRDRSESPFTRLARMQREGGKALFDAGQVKAGERLRVDYEKAHLAQRVTASYAVAETRGDSHWRISDNAVEKLSAGTLAARQRVHAALAAVGPELSGILLHVCCLVAGLEEAERQLALPRRSGRAVLGLALTRLSRHYGFLPELAHGGPQRIGHWAVPDYRPTLNPAAPSRHQP